MENLWILDFLFVNFFYLWLNPDNPDVKSSPARKLGRTCGNRY